MDRKFSVACCVYINDDHIIFRQSLESLLCQSVKPNQIVLVCDGHLTEDLDYVIDEFQERCVNDFVNFNCIRLKNNIGHGPARKISLDSCTNEIVAISDADDVSNPCRFEVQLQRLISDKELALIGGQIEEFNFRTTEFLGVRKVPNTYTDITSYIKFRCPFNQMTVMFRKSKVEEVGGYQEFYHNEDYYLWVRMYLAKMKMENLPILLVKANVNVDSYIRRGGIKYFRSEMKLKKFMYDNKIIGLDDFIFNALIRVFVQLIIPSRFRSYLFRKIFRSGV